MLALCGEAKQTRSRPPAKEQVPELELELDQLREVRLGMAGGSGSRALTQGTELGGVTAKQPRASVWREH